MASGNDEENSLNDSFVDEPSGDDTDGDNDSLTNILKRLPAGAVVKPLKKNIEKHHCFKCVEDFETRELLLDHIVDHVTQPQLILERIDDDAFDEDDDWSDEDFDDAVDSKPIRITLPSASTSAKAPALDRILNSNIIIKKIEKPNITAGGLSQLSIKKVPLPTRDDDGDDSKSTGSTENVSTPPLRITIKHNPKDNNFRVVDRSECENRDTSNITNAPPPEKNMEPVDSKEGILSSIHIKKEPGGPDPPPSLPNGPPLTEIKREVPSPNSADRERREKEEEEKKRLAELAALPKPIIIPKKEVEEPSPMIIEINGDDSDNDDLIFVSSSPPPDRKPVITELPPISTAANVPNLNKSVPSSGVAMPPASGLSQFTNRNYDWSSSLDPFNSVSEKNADDILKNLLDEHNRKDSLNTDYGTSEYISLDKLGPQHTCDVCKCTFTTISSLENHRKLTGHSNQLVLPSPAGSAVLPYKNSDMGLMNSFFPVKQLAETVGKLTGANPNSSFTHQQNIMVNIQSFPPGHQPYMGAPHNAPGNLYGNAQPGFQPEYRMPGPPQQQQPPYGTPYPNQPYNAGGYPGYPPNVQQPPNSNSSFAPPPYSQQMPHPQQPLPPTYSSPYPMPPQGQTNYPMTSINSSVPNQNFPPSGAIMSEANQSQPHVIGGNIRLPINTSTGQTNSMGQIALNSPVKLAPNLQARPQIRPIRGAMRGRGVVRPGMRPSMNNAARRPGGVVRPALKIGVNGSGSPGKKRFDMLLPNRHDNEDCETVSIQHQKEGMPLIHSIQGSKETPVQLNSQITVTKKRVRPPTPPPVAKDANTVASMLARRGIKITQKAKSPSPPPINIPNLGSGIVITHTKSSSSEESKDIFSARTFKCDLCPVSYSSAIQLQEHKRMFHSSSSGDYGLPVVDLSQQANLRKLNSLGICNFIPLANREQGSGCFGIPIVSMQNANASSLQALGSNGVLSLGPIKQLPKC